MSIKVACPKCAKELSAPDHLVGRLVACPRCFTDFPVTTSAGNSAGGSATKKHDPSAAWPPQSAPTTPPPPPVTPPPATQTESPSKSSGDLNHTALRGGGGTAKPIMPSPSTSQPPAPPQPSDSAAKLPVPLPPPETPRKQTPGQDVGPPSQRKAKTAKFVTDGAAQSRINLGADGQLPDLVVEESKVKEEPPEKAESSRPILLVGVLGFSVLLSIVMLFVPDQSRRTDSSSRQDALSVIEKHYIGAKQQQPLAHYQSLLRQAIQAENEGDRATAQRLFKQVLGMLYAEGNTGRRGLTGIQYENIKTPPSDADLEAQLKTLLRD